MVLLALLCFILNTNLSAQAIKGPGYPDRSLNMDPWNGFVSPPKGYGEVPFFWWQGDTITREKLTWQLDQMASRHVSSLQINYSHTDKGGFFWGLSSPSKPALFTEEWWTLFGWFMTEAKKRGMTVSLSDYTLGVGQGFSIDAVMKEYPDMVADELIKEQKQVKQGNVKWTLSAVPVSIMAYRVKLDDGTLLERGSVDLLKHVNGKNLEWNAPKGDWMIISIYSKVQPHSYNPMHPMAGKAYVKHFFQPFESRFPELSKGGLGFFFSDELDFHLHGIVWDKRFRDEFRRRKGYDIVPCLAALFADIGGRTPKIRMDYNDVYVSLSEENYFKPVYDWHEERGLIYGCDHGGRGKSVDEFGDYFRTQRWNQGPGCDQPGLARDIIKNKVASSISHLYNRPRVWLEGFYGSGWQTSSANLTDAIFSNFVMGQNLLSLHGLYYATPGGWWEWAPPCNHYRMPYWEEMKTLLGCTERLSYLFSQGHHCADVAMLYPTEPVVAGYGKDAVKCAFGIGETLYKNGIDFDFMDYESLQRAEIKDAKLNVTSEKFSILIIPSMKAICHASLEKALAFKRAGGTVIIIGELPEATELNGRNDRSVTSLVNNLLSDKGNGMCVRIETNKEAIEYINSNFTRDFAFSDKLVDLKQPPYVMHRKIGQKDYYAVYNVEKGQKCFFRAKGGVEIWNPWTGKRKQLAVNNISNEGTTIAMPLSSTEMQILVFDSSIKPLIDNIPAKTYTTSIPIEGKWFFEVKPSLDNKFGDFYWPATDEKVSPMVNFLKYDDGTTRKEEQVGYTSRFKVLQGIAIPLSEKELLAKAENTDKWDDLTYSWRWGVKGDCGHQGYHGLKLEMYDDFIRLGKMKYSGTGFVREKNPDGDHCYLLSNVFAPTNSEYVVEYGDIKPLDFYLNGVKQNGVPTKVSLRKGVNRVLLHYTAPCKTYLVFIDSSKKGTFVPGIEAEKPLAMKWNGDLSILPYDLSKESITNCDYSFMCAPGMNKMEFWAYGNKLQVWAGNETCSVKALETRIDGLVKYEVSTPRTIGEPTEVRIRIDGMKKGFGGTSAIPYPIKQTCGKGEMKIGDWTSIDGLRCYSGGAWYRKTVQMDADKVNKHVELDLGDVVSTARVFVNGKEIGLRMTPPWNFDLDGFLKSGDNLIEILVYNTAGNHYESIPTQYLKDVKAGILGPVNLRFY